jgi:hypothetical protein
MVAAAATLSAEVEGVTDALAKVVSFEMEEQRRSLRGASSMVRGMDAKAVDSSPECRDGEYQGIELLIIPQLREVETNRRTFSVAICQYGVREPLKSF